MGVSWLPYAALGLAALLCLVSLLVLWRLNRAVSYLTGRVGIVEQRVEYPTEQVRRLTDTFSDVVVEELQAAADRIDERLDPTVVREKPPEIKKRKRA